MKVRGESKRPDDVREEGPAVEVEEIADLELPAVLADDVHGGRCAKVDISGQQTMTNP